MIEIIALFILLGLSAFFSASETAITSLSRIKVTKMLEQKVPGAKIIRSLKEKPAEFISIILIGNNIVNTAAAALTTSIVFRFFAERGWGAIGGAIGAATGIATFLLLVFGEITPKTVAIHRAETISVLVAPPVLVLSYVLKPIAYFVGFISRPFILLLGGKAPEKGPFITEEEIKYIISAGEKEGVIEEEEKEMLTSIFEFTDTVAREVMTPRENIIACAADETIAEVVRVITESGHSRIPIFEGNLDNVVGVVYAKDLLTCERGGTLREIAHPAFFISEKKNISELMEEMQEERKHLAIIIDELGRTTGLVSLEDLIEEIVGEIHDEFERKAERRG